MLEMERIIRRKQEWRSGKVYTFRCAICATEYELNEPGEPLCTGPHPSLDEHLPELALLVKLVNLDKVEKNTPPGIGEARAAGPLWIPP